MAIDTPKGQGLIQIRTNCSILNTPDSQAPPRKYQVPSVDSACRILKAVCGADQPLPMSGITRIAQTSRTTTMRIVSSLCDNGFLARDDNGRISAGAALGMLGARMPGTSDLRQRATPILEQLAATICETAHLAVPLDTHCLLQQVVDSPEPIRVASRPGTLVDYHCSSTGKSILAFRRDLVLRLRTSPELAKRTRNTLTTWPALEAELERVRTRGYAVDEEEYHPGVRCVGAPVRDNSGKIIAAIGVTGATNRLTKRRIPAVAKQLISAANQLASTI